MTTEKAVRDELREAIQNRNKLFGEFCHHSSDPVLAQLILFQYQLAVDRVASVRSILHGVIEGEHIRADRQAASQLVDTNTLDLPTTNEQRRTNQTGGAASTPVED